jgi:hypothetical protein
MEIKINKEIRGYQESVFFGLSSRQFFCSLLAVGITLGLYFGLHNQVGKEALSWLCILAAAPVAAAGFFRYHSMNLEQFLWAVLKSALLCSGHRKYRADNYYWRLLQNIGGRHA